jgi:hypothetical protein
MFNSTRHAVAEIRACYTDETLRSALAGVAPDGSLGLDACSPAQAELRALLALHLFNVGAASMFPGHSFVFALSWYRITVSPRYHDLVLITDEPDNVISYMVRQAQDAYFGELPGLRVESFDESVSGIRLRHLPTGASITVTADENGHLGRTTTYPAEYRSGRFATLHVPMSTAEKDVLNRLVQPTTPDVRTLLAALVARFSAVDAQGQWAIGLWYQDPLRRPNSLERPDRMSRRLWGNGEEWEMRWNYHPRIEDISGALTDPVAGLQGAHVIRRGGDHVISFGSARLTVGRL